MQISWNDNWICIIPLDMYCPAQCVEEQSDQDLHCLPFLLHLLDLPVGLTSRATRFKFQDNYIIFLRCEKYLWFLQYTEKLSYDMTKPTKWACAQRRLRSAWASAQTDQSSLSAWRKLGSLATHWAHSKDFVDAQADMSLRWAHMPLCWFVMRQLKLLCCQSAGVKAEDLQGKPPGHSQARLKSRHEKNSVRGFMTR